MVEIDFSSDVMVEEWANIYGCIEKATNYWNKDDLISGSTLKIQEHII